MLQAASDESIVRRLRESSGFAMTRMIAISGYGIHAMTVSAS
jgi:hypothetical protein